jgi:hypothetical protein
MRTRPHETGDSFDGGYPYLNTGNSWRRKQTAEVFPYAFHKNALRIPGLQYRICTGFLMWTYVNFK